MPGISKRFAAGKWCVVRLIVLLVVCLSPVPPVLAATDREIAAEARNAFALSTSTGSEGGATGRKDFFLPREHLHGPCDGIRRRERRSPRLRWQGRSIWRYRDGFTPPFPVYGPDWTGTDFAVAEERPVGAGRQRRSVGNFSTRWSGIQR